MPRRMTLTPTDEDYRRLLELPQRSAPLPALERTPGPGRGPHPGPASAAARDPRPRRIRADRRSATSPATCCCATTAPVGLVDRAERPDSITRGQDADNLSVVRLHLTDRGSRQLEALSEQHLEELAHLAPTMHAPGEALEGHRDRDPNGDVTPPRHPSMPPRKRYPVLRD